MGLDIIINFKLKDGNIDKVYLSIKKKDLDNKTFQSCGNDDQCPQICDENLNMCI